VAHKESYLAEVAGYLRSFVASFMRRGILCVASRVGGLVMVVGTPSQVSSARPSSYKWASGSIKGTTARAFFGLISSPLGAVCLLI
jgi:hypothetical protein